MLKNTNKNSFSKEVNSSKKATSPEKELLRQTYSITDNGK